MQKLILLLLPLLFTTNLSGQEIIETENQGTSLAFILQAALEIPIAYNVDNIKVTYTTTDAFGQPDTATGLLCLPQNIDLAFPLAIYNHGTVGARDEVPSVPGIQERFIVQALAGSGFITMAPDYLGLGDSDGIHPYVHAATEASAGRDMAIAVKAWLEQQDNITANDQLFVTGYSQGGHAAAALHRDIATNPGDDSLTVTAATYLSGPYSISEVMLSTLFSEDLITLPGYIAYTYVSYNFVYGLYDDLSQVFVEPYLTPILSFANQESSLSEFNIELETLLVDNQAMLGAIFRDSILQILEARDESSEIIQALIENDTYDWAPEAPTLLYYCTEDEQVPFRNAILADSVMRSNGSTSVLLEAGGALTHRDCVFPAVERTIEFFKTYANVTPTSLGVVTDAPEVNVAPNPVAAGSTITVQGLTSGPNPFILYDFSGRQILNGATRADGSITLPRSVPKGPAILRIGQPGGTSVVRRLIVK